MKAKTREIYEVAIKPGEWAYKAVFTRGPKYYTGYFSSQGYNISYRSYSRLLRCLANIRYYGILTV